MQDLNQRKVFHKSNLCLVVSGNCISIMRQSWRSRNYRRIRVVLFDMHTYMTHCRLNRLRICISVPLNNKIVSPSFHTCHDYNRFSLSKQNKLVCGIVVAAAAAEFLCFLLFTWKSRALLQLELKHQQLNNKESFHFFYFCWLFIGKCPNWMSAKSPTDVAAQPKFSCIKRLLNAIIICDRFLRAMKHHSYASHGNWHIILEGR